MAIAYTCRGADTIEAIDELLQVAEPLLIDGYQRMLAMKARLTSWDSYHLERAREWLVQLNQAWAKLGQAAEWKRK